MGIQNILNTMYQHLAPTPEYHAKLMKRQMKGKCILELIIGEKSVQK
jgi:hypothetical protein